MKSAVVLALAGLAFGAPHSKRQAPCFVVGSEELPEEVADIADAMAADITCDAGRTTISGVPDVQSGDVAFSSVNFADSDESPLAFALSTFATATLLADSNLAAFEGAMNAYIATEIGLRSVGGSLDIKVPKFFLQFQVARIQQAQGIVSDVPGLDVPHQLEKVLKNAAGESQELLDEVNSLAITLE